MGLSSLPAPSEGMLCVLLMNTAVSISIVKGIVRTILHIVGIGLSSLSTSSPQLSENYESPREQFELLSSPSERYVDELRSKMPTTRFDAVCTCKHQGHECSVCLTQFEPDSEVNKLACGHLFHKVCLERWLDYSNITCPLCRTPLKTEEDVSCCF